MSIIADLLSKLKFQGNKGDVPPGLKKVVLDDVKKRDTHRKIIAIAALVLVAVLSGLATIQLIDTYIKPSKPAPGVASKAKPAPEPPVVAKTVPWKNRLSQRNP
ncbi:MAG: hypothetical protein C0415_01455 [Thermodesulfovibrio sp.]|nr:hypothetical protein [Thermodesulfovibrio sp.]